MSDENFIIWLDGLLANYHVALNAKDKAAIRLKFASLRKGLVIYKQPEPPRLVVSGICPQGMTDNILGPTIDDNERFFYKPNNEFKPFKAWTDDNGNTISRIAITC